MEVRKVEEDLAYKNILSLLNYDFEKICYEIVWNAERQESYRELLYEKELFLEGYPVMQKLVTMQPVDIKEYDIKCLKEFHTLSEKIRNELMKEAYFRGIKDVILLLNRADLLGENL